MNWPIEELIPQRKPFVFVDEVLEFTDQYVKTAFVVKDDNMLVEGNSLLEAGLIENMAQSAAALEGCNAKLNKSEVKIGFIGSIKKLEISVCPNVGDKIETEITILTNAIGVNVAEGIIRINNQEIAKCILNIFLKED